jgi:hypothetical protein
MVFSEDYGNQIANKNYVGAILECRKRKTYIKWYSNAFCPGDEKQKQHWTSITRGNKLFSLTIYGKPQFKPSKEKRNTSCTTI